MEKTERDEFIELIHDALDAYEYSGYHDRETGIIDMTSSELAGALLAAGWRSPEQRLDRS